MRTTLTLEPDVAARIQVLRERDDWQLKDLINAALRRGLQVLEAEPEREPFTQMTFSMKPRFDLPESMSELIEQVEGPWHR